MCGLTTPPLPTSTCARRHFLAWVGDTEIPFRYARKNSLHSLISHDWVIGYPQSAQWWLIRLWIHTGWSWLIHSLFNGPDNLLRSCQARSVNPSTLFLDRLHLGERELVYVLLVHLFCMRWFFSLPFDVRGWLRLVIVALPGLQIQCTVYCATRAQPQADQSLLVAPAILCPGSCHFRSG